MYLFLISLTINFISCEKKKEHKDKLVTEDNLSTIELPKVDFIKISISNLLINQRVLIDQVTI